MPAEQDVLLRLVIKGMDPAEIAKLAQMTAGQLQDQMAVHLIKLTQLHKQQANEQMKIEKDKIAAQIKEEQKLLHEVLKVHRATEIATNRANAQWRMMMKTMSELTLITRGVWDIVTGGANRFKAFGDEMIRTTNIFGSLKGSIDGMRDASEGQIADIDLIRAKNKAMLSDLELTDEQFGTLAGAADMLGDALGTNAADGLDSLVQALATGRTKMLASMGVVIDTEKAYQKYADTLDGRTADSLDDNEKKLAIQAEVFANLNTKLAEAGDTGTTVAKALEQAFAATQNVWDRLVNSIGSMKVPSWMVLNEDGAEGQVESTQGLSGENLKMVEARNKKIIDAKARRHKRLMDAQRAATNQAAFGGDETELIANGGQFSEGEDITAQYRERFRIAGQKQRKGGGRKEKGSTYDPGLRDRMIGMDEDERATEETKAWFTMLEKRQEDAEKVEHDDWERMLDKMDEISGRKEEKATFSMKHLQNRFAGQGKAAEKAGGGIMAQLLWGADGKPDQMLAEMDKFQQAGLQMAETIGNAAEQMVGALGQSMVSMIAGSEGAKKTFAEHTNEIIRGLSAQAFVMGLMELAKGFGALAVGNFASAPLHFKAAGMFGAVGVGAAIMAKGAGNIVSQQKANEEAAKDKAAEDKKAARKRGGEFNSSSSTSRSEGGATIIHLHVAPGGEAEAGRQISKASKAYAAETGGEIMVGVSA
jgi:hypothetical protein